jgi:phosphoglycolate phosphatase
MLKVNEAGLFSHIEKFETIIWDWNGTLLNDNEAAWKSECKLFESVGRAQVDAHERRKLFTMPVREYYSRLGFDFTKISYEELAERWFKHYEAELESVDLFEGTEKLLQQVLDAGKKQFILSAAPESHLRDFAKEKNLLKYFTGIYGLKTKQADCKRARGQDLFSDHAIDPKKSILIGDMVHDAEVAETLGCEVLLIADGHQAYEVLLATTKNVLPSRFL